MHAKLPKPQYVIIANPENRRVTLFQEALHRLRFPPAIIVPWIDFLTERIHLQQVVKSGSIIRVESPGENFEVDKQLLLSAIDPTAEPTLIPKIEAGAWLSREQIASLEFDRGLILPMLQWFTGFSFALHQIEWQLARCLPHRIMSVTRGIGRMFDKTFCRAALHRCLPGPHGLPARSFDELIDWMRSTGLLRVFVKPRFGSSASGIVALAICGERIVAYTPIELVQIGGQTRLYNSLKIRRYTDWKLIGCMVDWLFLSGDAYAEEWMPKATIDGSFFDLRVVVIGGRARHVVPRLSAHPITNLHLGNRRGDAAKIKSRIGEAAWTAALRSCERALAVFSKNHYAGVDVLIRKDFKRHAILELNAFGDLLPGVLCDGRDTYTEEILSFQSETPPSRERTGTDRFVGDQSVASVV